MGRGGKRCAIDSTKCLHYLVTPTDSECIDIAVPTADRGRSQHREAKLFRGPTVSKRQSQEWNLGLSNSFYYATATVR